MLAVVFVLYLTSTSYAFNARCNENTEPGISFTKSGDAAGRYTIEFCTEITPNITEWTVDMLYIDPAYCNRTHRLGNVHSHFTIDTVKEKVEELNCSNDNVCLSDDVELVFNSCYNVKCMLTVNGRELAPQDKRFNINNSYEYEYFNKKIGVTSTSHENDTTLIFFTGVPAKDFEVQLVNSSDPDDAGVSVRARCVQEGGAGGWRVRCALAPAAGCWVARLQLAAAWAAGRLAELAGAQHAFCREAPRVALDGARWRLAWGCGAVLGACGAGVLLAAACRRSRAAALHKRVLAYWRDLTRESVAEPGACEAGGGRPVLLLYAREGGAGAALGALLRRAGAGPVWDLFSGEVLAAAARAPAEWVRAALARRDVRVVLLQTPALAALYGGRADLDHSALKLGEPLLGRRLVHRAPHFGDTLLQYALRLLADGGLAPHTPHAAHAYNKYYLATLSELPTELFPQVVPFRRYPLPAAAELLLGDLGGPGGPGGPPGGTPELAHFQQAVAEFVQLVRDNPDYLMDDLIVM